MKYFNLRAALAIAASALLTLIVAAAPSHSLEATRKAMVLCESTVIPSLFPFFVCSGILVQLGAAALLGKLLSRIMTPVFRLSGSSSLALIMGLISGYPVGAKCVSELVREGNCHKSEGEKLLAFCNNSGPLFILGAVGSGMLGSASSGVVLYISHFLSSITIALLFRNIKCRITTSDNIAASHHNKSFGEILTESIKNAADSVFTISGFVIIFNILLSSADHFGIIDKLSTLGMDKNICRVFMYGIFEPTNGCLAASEAIVHPIALYLILSSIIGWSGISVHLQVLGIIKKANLSPKYYFIGKLLMTVISPVYTYLILCLSPATIPVFGKVTYNLPGIYLSSWNYFVFAAVATTIFVFIIYGIYILKNVHKKFTKNINSFYNEFIK